MTTNACHDDDDKDDDEAAKIALEKSCGKQTKLNSTDIG